MRTMHVLATSTASLALLGGIAAHGHAAMIASSTIRVKTGDSFQCVATNVSAQKRDVELDLLTSAGVVMVHDGATLLAGRATAIALPVGGGIVDGWCRITVKGGRSSIRGTLNLLAADTITLLESIVLQ